MDTRTLHLKKQHNCAVCGADPASIVLDDGDDGICQRRDVQGIAADAAQQCSPGTVFLDVREDAEWRGGHIQGARHIPLGRLLAEGEALDDLPLNAPIVVYCQHGIRSLTGAAHLQRLGYTRVQHLEGGFVRWPQRA